jgi:uncharacterized protein with WD repeat
MTTKKSAAANTEIRIGIAETSQELHISSELSQEKAVAAIKDSMDKNEALLLTDVKGRQTLVPASKISFVEVGESEERKVGFGSL